MARNKTRKESPLILPRDYGLVETEGEKPLFFAPAAFAIGEVNHKKEKDMDKAIESWQEYKANQLEEMERGESYTPLFPVTKKHLDLLSIRSDLLNKRIKEQIKKIEGTKNLTSVGGKEAIKDGYVGSQVATGRVKGKSDGRLAENLKYWPVMLRTGPSDVEYVDADCECHDYFWGSAKGVIKVCVHLGSFMTELVEDSGLIEREYPDREFWLPFNFLSETGFPVNVSEEELEEISRYLERQEEPSRSYLMTDIVIARYVMNKSLFEINKAATRIPNIYDPRIIDKIREGKLKFGVLRQKRGSGKKKYEDYWKAVDLMWDQMYEVLKRTGFERRGPTYAMEFRDTEFEAVCEDWVRGDVHLRPFFHEGVPPLIIERRENPDSTTSPFTIDANKRHPFRQLYNKSRPSDIQERIDDPSRRLTSFTIRIPGSVEIPDELQTLYRNLIDNFYTGDINSLKKLYSL